MFFQIFIRFYRGNSFMGIDNWSGAVDLCFKVLKDPSDNKLATSDFD